MAAFPNMTGADVAIALRAHAAMREMHFIMCTGTAEATGREGSLTTTHSSPSLLRTQI